MHLSDCGALEPAFRNQDVVEDPVRRKGILLVVIVVVGLTGRRVTTLWLLHSNPPSLPLTPHIKRPHLPQA